MTTTTPSWPASVSARRTASTGSCSTSTSTPEASSTQLGEILGRHAPPRRSVEGREDDRSEHRGERGNEQRGVLALLERHHTDQVPAAEGAVDPRHGRGDLVLVVGPVEDGGPPVALEHLDPPRQADGPQRLRAPRRVEPVAEDLGSSGDGKPGADHLVLLPVGRHLGDLDARLVQPDHEGVVVAPHVQGVADQPQRTLQLATPVLDDLPDARLGGSAHHPAARPEDADLVRGDLLHGGAEDVDMVETHVRQDLDPAAEDVGGVVGTTEADLDDGDVHLRRTEEREGEGHLELEVRRGAVRRGVRLDQRAECQRLVQDLRRKARGGHRAARSR